MRAKNVVLLWTLSFVASLRELDWELIYACGEGNVGEVKRILAAGGNAGAVTTGGESALHVSGIGGSAEIVRLLVAAGAPLDIRVTSTQGLYMTPLSWFVYGNHADGVQALIDAGASVNAIFIDESGTRITCTDIADRIKANDIASVLATAGGKPYEDLALHERRALLPAALLREDDEVSGHA